MNQVTKPTTGESASTQDEKYFAPDRKVGVPEISFDFWKLQQLFLQSNKSIQNLLQTFMVNLSYSDFSKNR